MNWKPDYPDLAREEIVPPRRYRGRRKRPYIPRHPWRFVVEYADGRLVKWEEGVWSGAPEDVTRLEARVASGELVPNAVPSAFPPDVLSVPIVILEVIGPWARILEDKTPEPPWFDDPPDWVH